jgi:hypothetical protein
MVYARERRSQLKCPSAAIAVLQDSIFVTLAETPLGLSSRFRQVILADLILTQVALSLLFIFAHFPHWQQLV